MSDELSAGITDLCLSLISTMCIVVGFMCVKLPRTSDLSKRFYSYHLVIGIAGADFVSFVV